MRIRSIGPGVGGLNYDPLLRHMTRRQVAAFVPETAIAEGFAPAEVSKRFNQLRHAAAIYVQAAWRRLQDARMRQAEHYIERAKKAYRFHAGPHPGRSETATAARHD